MYDGLLSHLALLQERIVGHRGGVLASHEAHGRDGAVHEPNARHRVHGVDWKPLLLRLHDWLLCHPHGWIGGHWSSDLAVVDVAVVSITGELLAIHEANTSHLVHVVDWA